ncbi:MAG TPA: cytochrome c biogenesis protein CcsA [Planctomycetota bacterium]|nr:cytochrome c biogenesis protein CcsA [Planctomycetota bacterium]
MILSWSLPPIENGLLYAALTAFGGAAFVGWQVAKGDRRRRSLPLLLGVGTAALTLLLLAITIREGHVPLNQRYEVLVTAAWGLGVGALLTLRKRGIPMLAAVAAPTLALLVFFAMLVVPHGSGRVEGATAGKIAHIVLATLGFAGFSVSAGVGLLYLRQIRLLKRSPSAALGGGSMPSLEKLDRVNFLAAVFGFPCLALSLLAGRLFLAKFAKEGVTWWLDPTVLVATFGLAVYTLLFLARGFLGWHGRRIAWLSVAGFVVTVGGFVVAAWCTAQGIHP